MTDNATVHPAPAMNLSISKTVVGGSDATVCSHAKDQTMDHPIQPVITDPNGTKRFKENKIVRYLLDAGGIDLNKLAMMPFDQNDREQFAQLIGYSLSGFYELSYVRDVTYEAADKMAEDGKSDTDARIEVLEEKLDAVRNALKTVVPQLFQIHPDDLVV